MLVFHMVVHTISKGIPSNLLILLALYLSIYDLKPRGLYYGSKRLIVGIAYEISMKISPIENDYLKFWRPSGHMIFALSVTFILQMLNKFKDAPSFMANSFCLLGLINL